MVETTPGGYTLTITVSNSGRSGRLALSCPDGHSLGTSGSFAITRGRFTALRIISRHRRFRFAGSFDGPTHVRGSGSVARGACGSVPQSFSEGSVGEARMLVCPSSSPEQPLAAGTPYPFAGIVPNAARGTRLRIEYTNPNSADGSPDVAHVVTDSSGRFSDTHVFPSSGGEVYGAGIVPRYPDNPLASGIPCDVDVQG
jgi:hypothetical protein